MRFKLSLFSFHSFKTNRGMTYYPVTKVIINQYVTVTKTVSV